MASIKDLKSGDRFGRLTAIRYVEHRKHQCYWEFECDCGIRKTMPATKVIAGTTKSCGCFRKEFRAVDISGQVFGKLTALELVEGCTWLFKCGCGTTKKIKKQSVVSGRTVSCGCHKNAVLARQGGHNKTHGMSGTKEHKAWKGMKDRCNPRLQRNDSHLYSARGIKVCSGWHNSFECFFKSMGSCPASSLSIDRIDNSKNYSCGNCPECIENGWDLNCRWANDIQQANNKRNNRLLSFNGQTLSVAQWAKVTNINQGTILSRLKIGWSVEKTLTEPIHFRG